ncbi:MAG: hypothetical protein ACFUZC_15700 [Chthoniobacteraceae bacterium]
MEISQTERQKVLELIETGRITPADGVELLKALQSQEPEKVIRLPGLSVIGTALVVIGFFLPWAKVTPIFQLRRMLGKVDASGNFVDEIISQMPPDFRYLRVPISGADINFGAGWQILLLGLAAALLILWPCEVDAKIRRWIRAVLLGIGSVLLGMLWVEALQIEWQMIGYGVFVVSAGFVLLWVDLFRFRKASV